MPPYPARQDYILIVDDTPENLEVLKRILSRNGFNVLTAADGETALTIAKEHQPQLILLDVMMPGAFNGFEVCELLKRNTDTGHIPVIFVTSLSDASNVVHGFDVGAVDYIVKPFNAGEVLARVNTHLTLLRQRHEIEHLREQDRLYYQKISEMKEEVMQMTSHDLKNPLNNVRVAVSLLRRHGRIDDDEGQDYLDILEASAQQMQTLIASILDLAKIETGQALNYQAVSLADFVQHQVMLFQLTAQQSAITLHYVPSSADVEVIMDADRIGQVLQNLLSNAIKYTGQGGTVTIRTQVITDWVQIDVEDNGQGIPMEALPHLFDKFYRVPNNTDQIEGTGLGLSIAKSIMHQHGGSIHAESIVGTGSLFTVRLPLSNRHP